MEELKHITVMFKLAPLERILTDPGNPGAIWLIKEGLVSLTYGDVDGKDATVLLNGPGDLIGAIWRARRTWTTARTSSRSNRRCCAA